MLTHGPWNAIPGLRHGFLDARDCTGPGGWEGVLARVGSPFSIAVPRQVHGTPVLPVPAADERPEADGLVLAAAGRLAGPGAAGALAPPPGGGALRVPPPAAR